jgi:hypothetical protein
LVVKPGGGAHSVRETPFSIGGSDDHLAVPGWPDNALVLHVTHGALLVEAGVPLQMGAATLEPDTLEVVISGASLKFADQEIRVLAEAPAGEKTTQGMDHGPLPDQIVLEYLPNGGSLKMHFGTDTVSRQLAELRFRLLVSILSPPGDYQAGQFIPDEVVLPLIWPRQPEKSHLDLNLLVHRVRKDLLKAGINPTHILKRAKQGGGTLFRVAADATVEVI